MITLAIDTARNPESLAVFSKKQILAEASWTAKRDETKRLLLTIKKLLTRARLNFPDIGRIVAVRGPGSFTALRIGVAVANALAMSLQKPLVAVSAHALTEGPPGATFGQTLMALNSSRFKKEFPVAPQYSKPPNITLPRHGNRIFQS